MRLLGRPLGEDRAIVSGEASAVTAGLLFTTAHDPQKAPAPGLDGRWQVLLFSTAGDTDSGLHRQVPKPQALPILSTLFFSSWLTSATRLC